MQLHLMQLIINQPKERKETLDQMLQAMILKKIPIPNKQEVQEEEKENRMQEVEMIVLHKKMENLQEKKNQLETITMVRREKENIPQRKLSHLLLVLMKLLL